MTEIYDKTKGHAVTEPDQPIGFRVYGKGDFAKYAVEYNREAEMELITKIRNYEAPPRPDAKPQTLRDAADNLLLAIGMGWDLEGCAENLRAALTQSDAEATRDVFIQVLASLVAAVSLLKAGGKEAAPSDKMFNQMILDYERAIERGRAVALTQSDSEPESYGDQMRRVMKRQAMQSDAQSNTKPVRPAWVEPDEDTEGKYVVCVETSAQVEIFEMGALHFADALAKAINEHVKFYTAPPRPDTSAEIAELQERCADAQWLAFEWMERHDKVIGFISKNYPTVMMPNLPFPSPISRPDASAGLIEAAEWHEEKAEDCEAGAKRDPRNKIPHLVSAKRHKEAAKHFRARAANRSEK